MPSARALACPASLKAVLSARDAAAALGEGLRSWVDADELPVADGGEGTLDALHSALGGHWHDAEVPDAFGRPRRARWLELSNGAAAVESAEVIPLDPARLDPFEASSRGLGELIRTVGSPRELLVCLGGTANVDGGAGLLEVLGELHGPTRVACDVDVPLVDAARVFAAQKGASPEEARELENRLLAMRALTPYAEVPGAGAAGGLGAALAALGARLVAGAELVLEAVGFRERARSAALVVTGEGTIDRSSAEGKAPGEVLRICREESVRCALFGGRIAEPLEHAELYELSGNPERAREDLVALGARLAHELVE